MVIHVLVFGARNRLSETVSTEIKLLEEAAKKQGHKLQVIYSKECQLKFARKPSLLINNKRPRDIKALIVRANFLHSNVEQNSSLIRQFEITGVPVINDYEGVIKAKNKLHTLQELTSNNIPVPKTYILQSAAFIEEIMSDIGSYPVILKTLSGSHGSGVSIIESQRGLHSILQMLTETGLPNPVVIQEYVKEASGKDIRVFILGKRILAAMERVATKRGEFRSNFKLGGRVRVAELTAKEKQVAFAAARACGLDMAGVDILRSSKGPRVLEVNANPGLEGITKATGRDIAGEIIEFAVKRAEAHVLHTELQRS